MPHTLDTPLASLLTVTKGEIHPPDPRKLERELGLVTVGDLLHHYPFRYEERGEVVDVGALAEGETVTVRATVVKVDQSPFRPKIVRSDISVRDARGTPLRLTVFGRQWQVKKELPPGQRADFSGTVKQFGTGPLTLTKVVWSLPEDDLEDGGDALVPVYRARGKVTSAAVAKAVRQVLPGLEVGADPLPPEVREAERLLGLADALQRVHRPRSRAEAGSARKRLLWDEAFATQISLLQRRAALQETPATPRPERDDGLRAAFDRRLPFTLTTGQRTVGEELSADLSATVPMHRLLQGEVGSGKTLVALRAMLTVVDNGGQAALLAPTEVLAQQHLRSLRALLGPLATAGELGAPEHATRVALLTGSLGTAARRSALEEAESGAAGIVVGTHALLGEGVRFADLGLVVVDEQHRFGVEQRDALRGKGRMPHLLVMTATPIPRTVAMTLFGDLEVSTLRERPPGRAPVSTVVVPLAEHPGWVDRAWQRVREAADEGHAAFVVCPRIGGEEAGGAPEEELQPPDDGEGGRPPLAAVEEVAPLLADGELAGLRVAALHGRQPPEVKDDVMRRLADGRLDVVVATTVVEVGVDVPHATVMVVLDAQQFGISQLHQLRGRIGRGDLPGLCLLVTAAPAGSPSRERLAAVASTDDGFVLAQLDLEQRREGDVLGTDQSGGRKSFRLLSVLRHGDVVSSARRVAARLLADDPQLDRHPALRGAVATLLTEEQADFLEKA